MIIFLLDSFGIAMFDGYEWHGRRLEVREVGICWFGFGWRRDGVGGLEAGCNGELRAVCFIRAPCLEQADNNFRIHWGMV